MVVLRRDRSEEGGNVLLWFESRRDNVVGSVVKDEFNDIFVRVGTPDKRAKPRYMVGAELDRVEMRAPNYAQTVGRIVREDLGFKKVKVLL